MSDRIRIEESCAANRQAFEHGLDTLFDENLPQDLENAIARVEFARLVDLDDIPFRSILNDIYRVMPMGASHTVRTPLQWMRFVFADILNNTTNMLTPHDRAERLMGSTAFLAQYGWDPYRRAQLLVRAIFNELHRSHPDLARRFRDVIAPAPVQAPAPVPNSGFSLVAATAQASTFSSWPTPAQAPTSRSSSALHQTRASASRPSLAQSLASTSVRAPALNPAPTSAASSNPVSTSAPTSATVSGTNTTSTAPAASTANEKKRYWCPRCSCSVQATNDRGMRRHWSEGHKRSHRSYREDIKRKIDNKEVGPWTRAEALRRGFGGGCREKREDKKKRKQMEKGAESWRQKFQEDPVETERAAQIADGYSDFNESDVDFTQQKRAQGNAKAKEAKKSKKDNKDKKDDNEENHGESQDEN